MIRSNINWLITATAALLLAACDGCYQAGDERQLVLTFVQPRVGGELTDADDVDRVRAGLQYDVQLRLEWESLSDGTRTPADIEEAGLAVARQGEELPEATQGVVEPGGIATFPGVTFTTEGNYQLRATARDLASQQLSDPVTILISVKSIPNRPAVLTSRIVQDANGDLKLNAAELPPGTPIQVAITTVNLSSGTASVTANGQSAGSVPVANDQATLTLTVPGSSVFEGQYTLQISLVNTSGLQSAPSSSAPDTLTVTVDQLGPTITINAPAARDGGYGSRTLAASATVTGAPFATVSFEAVHADGGTMDAGSAVVDGSGTAATTVSVFEGRQSLVARVSDGVGNPGSDSVDLFVNTVACFVTITDPSNGSYLGPSQDAAPADGGFEYAVKGTAPDCANRPAIISVGASTFTGTTDATGAFSILVALQQGANVLRADVDNGAGVIGSAAADVFVGSADFRLVAPANNAVLNMASDVNTVLPKIQNALNWTGTPPPNATVTICSNLPASSGSSPCPDGSSFIVHAANSPPTSTTTYDDGAYQLKGLMLSGTAVIAQTPPVSIRVDSVRPLVFPAGIRLQNDANQDLKLNANEQSSGSATALITTSGMEDGTTVTIRHAQTAVVLGTGTVTANTATVLLSSAAGPEVDYPIVVHLVDAAGNPNQTGAGTTADPQNADAFATLRVDRVAPSCNFTQPGKSNLGPADDGSGAAGFQIHVECLGPADLGAVLFQANTTSTAGTVAGTVAAADFTVNATGTTTYALSASPTDSSGNAGPVSTRNVTADFDAPSVAITTPNVANSPYTQYTLATSVSVPGENNLTVKVFTTVGTNPEQLLGTLTVVSGTASGNITYPNGSQTLRAEVTDLAGNVGTDTESIVVSSTGCSISLSAPAPGKQFWNQADDLDRTSTPLLLEYAVAGAASNCPSRPVAVYRGTGGSRVLLNSGTANGSGAFSLPISLAEGPQHIEVEMSDSGGAVNFVAHDAVVDLTAPAISGISPSDLTVRYVAGSNVYLRGTGTPGYVKDLDSATAGAQVAVSFSAAGALGGKAYLLYQGTPVGAPADITSDPQSLTASATLNHSSSGTFELRVEDQAGNLTAHAKSATVDVIAPAAPSFTATATNRRTGRIDLSWGPVYDDGTDSASGAIQGHDLRWSNTVHLSSGVLTEDDFFNLPTQAPPRLKIETGGLLAASATSHQLTVPPMMTSFVALRAVDELGNYSTFTPSTSVNGAWPLMTFTNPGTNTLFAQTVSARGNFNDDAFGDFVVGAPGGTPQPGAVYVYFGASDPTTLTAQAVTTPDGSAGSQSFGWIVEMGNVSHAPPATTADLAVGAPLYNSVGRVYLYFGKAGTSFDSSASNAVIFQGISGEAIGRGLAIIDDLNGDGISELLLASHTANANRGRAFLFFGRSKAGWEALRVSGVIPMALADRIIEGPSPAGGGTFGNSFGWTRSLTAIGNVNGDGKPDFAVAASMDDVNKLFVMSGQAVVDKSATSGIPTLTTGDAPATPDESLLRLLGTDPGTGTSRDGFGSRIAGGRNVVGGSELDLLVSHPLRNRVHLFAGTTPGPFVSNASHTFSGSFYLGTALALADLNEDGRVDVLMSDSVTSASSVWVHLNSGVAGQEFDLLTGTGFWHSKLTSTSSLGRGLAVSDVNNDNKLDLIAGDTSGKVLLWY